jgi:hypothetical protein
MDRSWGTGNKKCDIRGKTGGLDKTILLCVRFIEKPDAENGPGRFWEVFFIFSKCLYHSLVGKAILFGFEFSLLDFLYDCPERIVGIDK